MKFKTLIAVFLGLQMAYCGSAQALTIKLNDVGGVTGSAAELGFQQAAGRWESFFSDNVTVNLNVGFSSLGANILGQTGSALVATRYANLRNALLSDLTSLGDAIATSNLAAGPTFDTLINRTQDNPNGALSATPYLDNDGGVNNTLNFMTRANAKALGLVAATDTTIDANITFSSDFSWDFDGSDGIGSGLFDFVGVAVHEIGHALGYVSGVDQLDTLSPLIGGTGVDDDYLSSTLDLFRYSDLSAGLGVTDMSADSRDKYFSIDGGLTNLAFLSGGVNVGDGRQASHWRDNAGIGIMDPTFAPTELGVITDTDLLAFDVIGWDLNSATAQAATIPEPTSLLLLSTGLLLVCRRRRC